MRRTDDELQQDRIEALQNIDDLESKSMEQLDELEDDYDDAILNVYREKRFAEIAFKSSKNKFGFSLFFWLYLCLIGMQLPQASFFILVKSILFEKFQPRQMTQML